MPFSGDTRHFLGMSKSTFFYVMVVWVIISTAYFSISSIQRDDRIRATQAKLEKAVKLGQEAHAANCAQKDSLENTVASEQVALARSKAAFAKNPNLLPNVPRTLIEQGWASQQALIDRQTKTIILLDKNLSCGSG